MLNSVYKSLHVAAKAAGVFFLGFSLNVSASIIEIDFFIDGNTWNSEFLVENNSSAGLDIIQFAFDLRPLASSSVCFDESASDCHSSGGVDFTPTNFADAGFDSYSILDAAGGIDSYDFLTVAFNDFNAGESFGWKIDIDDSPDGSVYGNDLIGAILLVEMSDGKTYQGLLQAVTGNVDAAELVITGTTSVSIEDSITPVPAPTILFASILVGFSLMVRGHKYSFRKGFQSRTV